MGSIILENVRENKAKEDLLEFESLMQGSDIKKFLDFMDQTNKFSGIILKKAELAKNFGKVYSQAVQKITELQFVDFDSETNQEIFLEIFGECGG